MLIHIFNSFDKCLSLYNKEGDKFRLIGFARTEFGEVHVLGQQFCFQFLQIYYFGYRYNGKATKVGVEDKGLRVCIADDSYSGISFELVAVLMRTAHHGTLGVQGVLAERVNSVQYLKRIMTCGM